jgi:uncharacterized protein with HEPN domain
MLRDDSILIKHILEAAEKSIDFLSECTKEDLQDDEKLALSIIRLLEIVGEAANQVSEGYRTKHPDIPWKNMVALRNRLIHGYFDVDLDIVWDTVHSDLQPVVKQLRKLIL